MSVVVAVAGHVDHGKSALVTALTGRETDRLVAEQATGHTIEVHAAHLAESATTLLDAPGHAGWVAATLAGLGAATHAVLVVAADDGVMPQTVDHATAVAALRLPLAAVAITRVDLVEDATVAAVARDVRRLLGDLGAVASSRAARNADGVPVLATSIRTGLGVGALADLLRTVRPAPTGPSMAGPDLWVDTSFHVPGQGVVAIGTLRHGAIAVGTRMTADDAEVRVRGVQHRGREVARAVAPARVALRLADTRVLARGTRLLDPSVHRRGRVAMPADAMVDNLGDDVLRSGGGWILHAGTGRTAVRVRPRAPIPAGHRGLATLLDDPGSGGAEGRATTSGIDLRPGDRFVLRDTGRRRIGAGGVVLCATGPGDGPRTRLASAWDDHVRDGGDRADLEEALAACNGGIAARRAIAAVLAPDRRAPDCTDPVVTAALRRCLAADVEAGVGAAGADGRHRAAVVSGIVHAGPAGGGPSASAWSAIDQDLRAAAVEAVVDELLASGSVVADGPRLRGRDHARDPEHGDSPADAVAVALRTGGLRPEPVRHLLERQAATSSDLHALVRAGTAHVATDGYAFHAEALDHAVATLAGLPGAFSVAAARDALGITRRHAVPLLELCDRLGLTTRDAHGRRTVVAVDRDG